MSFINKRTLSIIYVIFCWKELNDAILQLKVTAFYVKPDLFIKQKPLAGVEEKE